MTVAAHYFDLLRATQGEAIEHAAEACARSIAAGKFVFSFGTGHGSLPALVMFPRTGTIVGFRPIVESTMISFHRVWGDMGARQYRFIHAVEGYGRAICARVSSTRPTRSFFSRTRASTPSSSMSRSGPRRRASPSSP